ncbi:sensor histidine kinase [Phragmitibacter flavus]|uniref:Sensor histidine kinase n=1 Tax=Phragmitibacter flavus TaxID=2576071 RepID=A0A5R8KAU9_9BACT|nr:sensor histidine kinase [Phragmitibacter flavus]TLD69045.1 sensor histidine kinase [Phragmitibacter flavus]
MQSTHLVLFLVLLAAIQPAGAAEVVRSAAVLRAMAPDEAKKGLPVEMEAVVTFVDRSWGNLFVHDGTAGVYVMAGEQVKQASWIAVGQKVGVRGVTGDGFLPVIVAAELVELGEGVLPAPMVPKSLEAIQTPALDSQWVEVEGVVKRLADEYAGLTLYLQSGPLELPAVLPRTETLAAVGTLPLHLLERRVRVRAVAATQFNEQGQMSGRHLYLPGMSFLTLLDPAQESPPAPLRRVDELLRVGSPLDERVRLRGVVTHAVPEQMLFLRGDGGSMRIDSALTPDLKPGTMIEAEGYATFMPLRPGLNAAELQILEEGPPPVPLRLALTSERRSAEQYELVTLDADLVEALPTPRETILLCRAGAVVFEASLPPGETAPLALEPGMRLGLTGICELEMNNPFGIAQWTKEFTLKLRSARDVVILQRPPYWNAARLLMLLSAVGGAALLVAAWAWMLRRQVARQAAVIERQTTTKATLEERQRIARDLHDTLEQELSGLAILLDTTSQQFETGEGTPDKTLGLARQLLRRSREESRSTIRDLRSMAIEQLGLLGAMETMLRPLAESAGLTFVFSAEGKERRLRGDVESAFLRVAHEAVANAAKHSRGSRVEVRTSFSADAVKLDVSDDGTGFCPETAADDATGHFGLSGMRERAVRIGADLRLDAQNGSGTWVSLVWSHSRLAVEDTND